jgi:hypothetical protein
MAKGQQPLRLLWKRRPRISKLPFQIPTSQLPLHHARCSPHHLLYTTPTSAANHFRFRSTTGGCSIDPEQKNGPAQGPSTKSPLSVFSLSSLSISEEELDGNHLVLLGTRLYNDKTISVNTLIDTGASGFAFIDEEFIRRHNIATFALKTHRHLEVIDGRPIQSGAITQVAHLNLEINGHKEKSSFFVTKLGHYPIVLGIPWMQYHDVAIRFSSNTVTFDSPRCKKECLAPSTYPVTQGLKPQPIHIIGAAAFLQASKKPGTTTTALSLYKIKNA